MKIKHKQWIQITTTICLMFIGDFGDYILSRPKLHSCRIMHALCDNLIHLIIGLLSWIIVDPYSVVNLSNQFILVGLGSSLIDFDHFIAAKSMRIEDAMHAPYRGPFHCSGMLLFFSLMFLPFNIDSTFAFLISFVPHHLRDATRRGIFLYPPYVHTRPIPVYIVRIALVVFPWFIRFLRLNFNISDSRTINGANNNATYSTLDV